MRNIAEGMSRRGFLKSLGIAGAVLVDKSVSQETPVVGPLVGGLIGYHVLSEVFAAGDTIISWDSPESNIVPNRAAGVLMGIIGGGLVEAVIRQIANPINPLIRRRVGS